jgi:hypothetical protein
MNKDTELTVKKVHDEAEAYREIMY